MSEAMAARRRRRRTAEPTVSGRFVVILAVMISSAIIVYVLAITIAVPRLRISRVMVQADFEMERDELLRLAGLDNGSHYFSVDTAEIAARIESFPPIRSAVVQKNFPDTVVLKLDRRRPLVVAFVAGKDKTDPILIDETGTIFLNGNEASSHDIPVISGISFKGNVIGSTLPSQLSPLMKSIQNLRVSAPEIFELISEIRVEAHLAGDVEVLLYMEGFRVPVRMAGDIDPRTCTYALMVLDVLEQQGVASTVEELDFRSGEVVYRMKEAAHAGE